MQGPSPKIVRLGDRAQVLLQVDTLKNPPAPKVPDVDGLHIELRGGGVEERTEFRRGRRSYRRKNMLQHC